MKKKIAIDIDDVLLDFVNPFLTFWNHKYGTSFKKGDIFSFDLEKPLSVSKEEKNKSMEEFYNSSLFVNLPPILGARESLNFLNYNYENDILTSRQPYSCNGRMGEFTENSLENFFTGNYFKIFYSKNHEIQGESKADICRREGISFLIEDCLFYALECNRKGIPVFLMNNPWNQANLEGTLITRCENWEGVLQAINKTNLC